MFRYQLIEFKKKLFGQAFLQMLGVVYIYGQFYSRIDFLKTQLFKRTSIAF